MRLEEQLARVWLRAFTAIGLDPRRFIRCDAGTREKVAYAGLDLTPSEYAALAFGNGISALVLLMAIGLALAVSFQFPLTYAAVLSVAAFAFAVVASAQYVEFLAASRARDVDLNILTSARHMLAALKSGVPLYDAAAAVAKNDYGAVSELFSEALVRIREGDDVDAAFRSVAARTQSVSFKRFSAAIGYAMGHGTKLELVLEDFARQMEARQRHEVSMFSAEATKLGLLSVTLTGILPGMLVFIISQAQIIGNMRIGIALLLPIYAAFLLVKYFLLNRLMKATPGV